MKIQSLTKEFEGKIIYIQGTENARRKGGVTPLLPVTVKKVNRTKVILVSEDNREFNLTKEGKGEAYFNYDMYESLDHFKAERAISLIHSMFDHYSRKNLDKDKVLKVAEILEIDLDDSVERFLNA